MKKAYSDKILSYAKKIKAVNYLGGECIKCKEKNMFKLTFHHKNPAEKEFKYSEKKNIRWSILKSELDKCDVMCQNCHRELHYELNKINENDFRRTNKAIYLEYSGSKCIKCGYDNCPASLTFHHQDSNNKFFSIGGIGSKVYSIFELSEEIKNELDKCDLLCSNCHVMEHADLDFFEKNKEEIISKSLNIREIQPKIDRNEVYEMYKNGMRQIDIAKHFNASNGTISDIIKKIGKIPKRI